MGGNSTSKSTMLLLVLMAMEVSQGKRTVDSATDTMLSQINREKSRSSYQKPNRIGYTSKPRYWDMGD